MFVNPWVHVWDKLTGVEEPGHAILLLGIYLTPTLYSQCLSSTNARRTCNFNFDRCCQIALWRGCATLLSYQQCMRMNRLHFTALWLIMSISRATLNHPPTYLTDNSRAASCTKAFLTPSHFLTLSSISDAKIKSGAISTLLHICLRNYLHYLPLIRPKALQGKRSPALCFQYLFSIAPGTEVFWKHGTNWHLHLWHEWGWAGICQLSGPRVPSLKPRAHPAACKSGVGEAEGSTQHGARMARKRPPVCPTSTFKCLYALLWIQCTFT